MRTVHGNGGLTSHYMFPNPIVLFHQRINERGTIDVIVRVYERYGDFTNNTLLWEGSQPDFWLLREALKRYEREREA